MAYRKKRSYKTPSYRKKRIAYRKTRKFTRSRIPRGVSNNSITVRMRMEDFGLVSSTLPILLGAFNFRPVDLINWTSFATIWDSFTVKKVTWTMKPPYTNVNFPADDTSGTLNASSRQDFSTAFDVDSVGNPISFLDQLKAYRSCKSTTMPKTHSRSWTPTVLGSIRRSSVSNAYVVRKQGILDVATADLQMTPTLLYGYPPTSTPQELRISVTAWVRFTNIRSG